MAVEIVADSGCGFNPGDPEAKALGIHVLPLHTTFTIDGQLMSYADGDLDAAQFLDLMLKSDPFPATDGSVQGSALELYPQLADKTQQILSVHITSVHSVVYLSALNAAEEVMEKRPQLTIGVIDSKRISMPMVFLLYLAAGLASQGCPLPEIQERVITSIPKTGVVLGLSDYGNLVKSERLPSVLGRLGTKLEAYPLLGMLGKRGNLQTIGLFKGVTGLPKRLKTEVVSACEKSGIAKLVVLHTNAPVTMVEDLKGILQDIYPAEIPVKNIMASAIGLYANVGGLAVAFMTN